jgi:hypothetical protein
MYKNQQNALQFYDVFLFMFSNIFRAMIQEYNYS